MTIWSTPHHIRLFDPTAVEGAPCPSQNPRPWFDTQTKKRNHSWEGTSSEELDTLDPRATKRRRCSALEQGFADLSLYYEPQDIDISPEQGITVNEMIPDFDIAMDADDEGDEGYTVPVVLPSHIEEPEHDVPEIQMKMPSWYELSPNRILITDLDSFEAEDELTDQVSRVEINKPFLEHMNKPSSFLIPPERTNQALVLYRPISRGPEQKMDAATIERIEVETRNNQF